MKMKKAIKKIIALGTGTVMVGATLMGAMAAADLANYPAPFIKDGQLNTIIVFGDDAKTADVVGAVDIATSLQYNMKQTEMVGTGMSETSVEGGVKIETSTNKLNLNEYLNNTDAKLTDLDLPTILKDGTVTDESGNIYDYEQDIVVPGVKVEFNSNPSVVNGGIANIKFLSTSSKWQNIVTFPKTINVTELTNEPITLFGREFTFAGSPSDLVPTSIKMFAAGIDQTFTAGDVTTITVGDQDVDIEVIGVNTQSATSTATLKVNGESKSVTEGYNGIIGGIKVYVKDVFAYTAPITSGAVRLFIGSDDYVFEDGVAVERGGETIEGTTVDIIRDSSNKISKINITYSPESIDRADDTDEDDYEYLLAGESVVDPVFGGYKLSFEGMTPSYTDDSKEEITFETDNDYLKVGFTNVEGIKYDVKLLNIVSNGSSTGFNTTFKTDTTKDVITTATAISEDDLFILTTSEYTRILELDNVKNTTSDKNIRVKDIGIGGSTYEFSWTAGVANQMTFPEGDYSFTVSGETITVTSGTSKILMTQNGMKIDLTNAAKTNVTSAIITLDEDTDYDSYSESSSIEEGINVTLKYDSTNEEFNVDFSGMDSSKIISDSDNDREEFVTVYGTYGIRETEDNQWAKIYYLGDQTTYNVFFAPVDATATIGSSGSVESVSLNKIAVGMAKLASEVANVAAQNVISVGGPCANRVSASLMGNPAVCYEGFAEGSAKIKLFEQANGNVAMMVAGYTADDTRRAAKVIAGFDVDAGGFEAKYKAAMVGTEVEVTGTSMSDISVGKPVVATTTTVVVEETE